MGWSAINTNDGNPRWGEILDALWNQHSVSAADGASKGGRVLWQLRLRGQPKDATTISWKGPQSYVTLHIYPGDESEVDIITMEWDSQVKKFLQRIG